MLGTMSVLRHFCCIFLTTVSLSALPVHAQSSPPPLNDFSLEPEETEEPPSRVQGPVADGQRPRDLTAQPPQQQPAPRNTPPRQQQSPAPATQPVPRSNQPSQTGTPATQRQTRPQTTRPQQTGNTQPAGRADNIPPGGATAPAPGVGVNDNDAGLAPNDNTPPPFPQATEETPSQSEISAEPSQEDGLSPTIWALIAAMLAVLGGLAFFWTRRRKNADEEPAHETPPQPQPQPVAKARQPSPPAKLGAETKPEPKPVNNDGFVTSSLKAPQPAQPPVNPRQAKPRPAQPRPASPVPQGKPYKPAPMASNTLGDLRVEFAATSAGATLMNAVLGYRVKLHNLGKGAITNVRLHGTMVQASGSEGETDIQMQPLHTAGDIAAQGAEELKGEIRVPLAGIKPIEFNRQALFVPVARFLIEYTDADGKTHSEHHAFIVGREHEPPREKMAPFRLDLGPRNFELVGQRVLAV